MRTFSMTCCYVYFIYRNPLSQYNVLRQAVIGAYPQNSHNFHTDKAKQLYDEFKNEKDANIKEQKFQDALRQLKQISVKKKTSNMMFFIKANKPSENTKTVSPVEQVSPHPSSSTDLHKTMTPDSQVQTPKAAVLDIIKKEIFSNARAQQEAQETLDVATRRVEAISVLKGTYDPEFKTAVKERDSAEKSLRLKQDNAKRQRKYREERKRKILELGDTSRKLLKVHVRPGRPRIDELQPGLLETITELSLRGSGAHERRRAEILNSCRTLDDLARELKHLGFNLSRSGIYLRLIPRSWATTEGKRHITTVNVRLKRAQNEEHRHHPDTQFAKSTYDNLMALCDVLGSHDIACLSQDDKAKVPLGLPAANKQSSIVMNMEYRVKLPDHDFVVASGHKLTPSVIAALEIKPGRQQGAVSYSGPTYIGIRSGKHDSSVAATHAADLRHLYDNVDSFKDILYRADGTVKPILIVLVDGGPDENPRYGETIKFACSNFIRMKLDALFIATQAPRRSAYNPVERRMAPLSRFLAGIILPYETFGSHLNSQGVTVDIAREQSNFKKAGETLAEV